VIGVGPQLAVNSQERSGGSIVIGFGLRLLLLLQAELVSEKAD
jgi:hypothetical protein